jgi:hypothetical protein
MNRKQFGLIFFFMFGCYVSCMLTYMISQFAPIEWVAIVVTGIFMLFIVWALANGHLTGANKLGITDEN